MRPRRCGGEQQHINLGLAALGSAPNFTASSNYRLLYTLDSPRGADRAAIVATIASITARGQVSGTFPAVNAADHFGFVAQQITSFRLGVAKLALVKNEIDPAIFLGPTGDVAAREIA